MWQIPDYAESGGAAICVGIAVANPQLILLWPEIRGQKRSIIKSAEIMSVSFVPAAVDVDAQLCGNDLSISFGPQG